MVTDPRRSAVGAGPVDEYDDDLMISRDAR